MKGRIFAVMIAMLFGFSGITNATAADASANEIATAIHKDKGHHGKHVRPHHRRGRVHKAHAHHHMKHHKAKRGHHHHGHKHLVARHHRHR